MATIKEVFDSEIEIQKRSYELTIERGIRMLKEARQSLVASTHLGHNLANVATELSVISAKIESTVAVRRYLESTNVEVG